jgi:hypothetical protein
MRLSCSLLVVCPKIYRKHYITGYREYSEENAWAVLELDMRCHLGPYTLKILFFESFNLIPGLIEVQMDLNLHFTLMWHASDMWDLHF